MSDSTRRLPVYMLLDTSGSMSGEPLESVKQGLQLLLDDLQNDPHALDTVWLSVITFDSNAKQVVPLTEIGSFKAPNLTIGGSTNMGDALRLLVKSIDKEVRKGTPDQKGDWKPLVFIMTDGMPDAGWETPAKELKAKKPANIIACAAGPAADTTVLKQITEIVVKLKEANSGSLGAFMKWVTASIGVSAASVGTKGDAAINLPALPADGGIQIVP